MPLHRLTFLHLGVPDVSATTRFYEEMGLTPSAPGRLSTAHGGEQLRLDAAPRRCVRGLGLGVDDPDDIERIARALGSIGVKAERFGDAPAGGGLRATDPGTGVPVEVTLAPRFAPPPAPPAARNAPGRIERENARAPGIDFGRPVRPSRLCHVVFGSKDCSASRRFFLDGLGFRVSDRVGEDVVFMRCSTSHHDVLVQPAPVAFLHHAAWEVADVDEVGRGAQRMLDGDPGRHVWGLGRHHIGSNWFWYLRDPAGNFAEYTSDVDAITDDEKWEPGDFAPGRHALYAFGPTPTPAFVAPPDLAELMKG